MKTLMAETQRDGERSQQKIASVFRTVFAVLREVFDESAFDRYLARQNLARSIASYRAFLREREASMVRKPRCC